MHHHGPRLRDTDRPLYTEITRTWRSTRRPRSIAKGGLVCHPCRQENSQVVEVFGCGAAQFIHIATRESDCPDWQEPNSKLASKNRSSLSFWYFCAKQSWRLGRMLWREARTRRMGPERKRPEAKPGILPTLMCGFGSQSRCILTGDPCYTFVAPHIAVPSYPPLAQHLPGSSCAWLVPQLAAGMHRGMVASATRRHMH